MPSRYEPGQASGTSKRTPKCQTADWQPVRELRAGEFTVRLEDTDPYRDCHQWPAAPRLTAAEAAAWQAQFEEAWQLIEHAYPRYAPGVAAGLRVLMPLANDVPGRESAPPPGRRSARSPRHSRRAARTWRC